MSDHVKITDLHKQYLDLDEKFQRVQEEYENLKRHVEGHQRIEESLQKERDLISRITETSPVGIVVVNTDGEIIYANARAEEILGLVFKNIAQRTYNSPVWKITDFGGKVYPEERLPFNLVKTIMQPVYDIQHAIEWPDGKRVLLSINAAPLLDQSDYFNGMVASLEDITKLKETEKAILQSEERFRMISELTSDYAYAYRVEENGELVNEWVTGALTKITGYSSDELEDQGGWESMIFPEDMEIPLEQLKMILSGKSKTVEYRITHKDGSIRWTRDYAQPVWDDQAESVTHIFGAIQDITEQKLAEAALQEYSERLEEMVDERTKDLREAQEKLIRQEKLAILGQLAGGVGHDLRNPLSVINNAVYYLNMLQSDADESTQEYLNIIKMEVNTAERIVTDLLNFARTKDPTFDVVSPSSMVEQALVKNPAPKSVEVSVGIPTDLPLLYVDSRQIIQVLGNLIVNGYQAMPSGGKLLVCACTTNQEIEISVSDTGIGIAPENIKSIFEPLFTTKAKGIGLGLATSKNLVEANGGTIRFQSKKDIGSTFSIRFLIKNRFISNQALRKINS